MGKSASIAFLRALTASASPVRVYATERQLTGTPYIHHAYVYKGNKVVMACTHRHGARGGAGGEKARVCAERMLRKYLRETTVTPRTK